MAPCTSGAAGQMRVGGVSGDRAGLAPVADGQMRVGRVSLPTGICALVDYEEIFIIASRSADAHMRVGNVGFRYRRGYERWQGELPDGSDGYRTDYRTDCTACKCCSAAHIHFSGRIGREISPILSYTYFLFLFLKFESLAYA